MHLRGRPTGPSAAAEAVVMVRERRGEMWSWVWICRLRYPTVPLRRARTATAPSSVRSTNLSSWRRWEAVAGETDMAAAAAPEPPPEASSELSACAFATVGGT